MKKVFLTLTCSILMLKVSADPGTPGGEPDSIPVDGGIISVVGIAAAYGVYKLSKEKYNKQDKNID